MRKPLLIVAALVGAALAMAAVAAATVTPSNAPSGTHFAQGYAAPTCTVDSSNDVSCGDGTSSNQSYVLGGVGHTNATLSLVGTYREIISCTNNGRQIVVAQQKTKEANGMPTTLTPNRNGQLTVPVATLTAPASAPAPGSSGSGSPCPNRNWTWTVESVTLSSYDYTLTFDGFSNPYIEIQGP
jgi:hypothetical protein